MSDGNIVLGQFVDAFSMLDEDGMPCTSLLLALQLSTLAGSTLIIFVLHSSAAGSLRP